MILHIPFTQNVRLKAILLKIGEFLPSDVHCRALNHSKGRGDNTPRHLRIYTNHSTIVDFQDAETTTPQLNISLLEGEARVVEYPLRIAAFASITSISLFFVRPPLLSLRTATNDVCISSRPRAKLSAERSQGCTTSVSRAMRGHLIKIPTRSSTYQLRTRQMPPLPIDCLKRQVGRGPQRGERSSRHGSNDERFVYLYWRILASLGPEWHYRCYA